MIRQLKYKILKNCTTQYIGEGGGGGNIPRGNFFMRTLDCRRKLERGGGGKEKPFSISTLPFPLLFPFLVSPAMHVIHDHLFLAPAFYAGYEDSIAVESVTYLASSQTSFGVRSSRIHFSPTDRGGEMNAWQTNPKERLRGGYNIPDFTRHGCCHQLKRNITKLKHQNRLLRVVKIIECICTVVTSTYRR